MPGVDPPSLLSLWYAIYAAKKVHISISFAGQICG